MEVTTDVDLEGYEVVIECPHCKGTGVDPVVTYPLCKFEDTICKVCDGEGFLEGPAHGEIYDVPVEVDPIPARRGYL